MLRYTTIASTGIEGLNHAGSPAWNCLTKCNLLRGGHYQKYCEYVILEADNVWHNLLKRKMKSPVQIATDSFQCGCRKGTWVSRINHQALCALLGQTHPTMVKTYTATSRAKKRFNNLISQPVYTLLQSFHWKYGPFFQENADASDQALCELRGGHGTGHSR